VAFAQNGFLTRDAGHRQVFRSRRANHVVGLVHGNLAVGSAFGWWVGVRLVGRQASIATMRTPIRRGSVPTSAARTWLRLRPGRWPARPGRVIARHQGVLFFPMLLLLALGLCVTGVRR
jgi:hypothetical protein